MLIANIILYWVKDMELKIRIETDEWIYEEWTEGDESQ
tara:strand:- start:574 stop:687 length:114 start_codon:yes stop_codon:yes gene_type:complete